DGGVLRGAILSLAYSLGLGIPFVLFALLFERALGVSRKLSAHRRTIGLLSGALLIAIGVLLMTGVWASWMRQLQAMISTFRSDGGVLRGAILSLAYSLGLGIPFVLFALLFERALGVSRKLSAHRRTIGLLSGALLIAIGVLLMTGVWASWMRQLQAMISTF